MYYKILDQSFLHRGYQFVLGENTYTGKWLGSEEKGGGFYICEQKHIGYWLKLHHNPIVCEVVVYEDSEIYPIKHATKVTHISLQNPLPIREFLQKYPNIVYKIIKQDGMNLEYVENKTLPICKLAVRQNGRALQFISRPCYLLCLEAVKQNGRAIQYVPQQSYILNSVAVKQNGLSLKYIKNKLPEICCMAVYQNGQALKFIPKQTPFLCRMAVIQNGLAFQHVKEKTEELYTLAIAQNPDIQEKNLFKVAQI